MGSEETAKLILRDRELDLPLQVGSENETAIEISRLRKETGCITLDEGFVNTGSTASDITFLNGEEGILRYRGYPIEELAQHCDFIEVSYLLIHGELPTASQLEEFRMSIRRHTMLHEDMKQFYDGFPARRPSDGDPQLCGRCTFHVLPGLARPARSRPGRGVDSSPDCQAADNRCLQLQEILGTAV